MQEKLSTGRHGAAVIVTDAAREAFIVQVKDETYRVPELIGCLSLIGGGMEPGETPRQTLERELIEEVPDSGAQAAVKAGLREWAQFSLEGDCRKIKYDYQLTVFVSELPGESFSEVAAKITEPGGLTEGTGRLLSREALESLCQGPGHFAWGIESVMRKYLSSDPVNATEKKRPVESAPLS